ncbi:cell division protein FtsZ [Klebsiella variicola]|nr:cell division protein FtsZ [Klebsiella variicola]
MYCGTTIIKRKHVKPGMLVKHAGKTWRASANVDRGLYLDSLAVKTRINDESVEVFLNYKGEPSSARH